MYFALTYGHMTITYAIYKLVLTYEYTNITIMQILILSSFDWKLSLSIRLEYGQLN